MSSSAPDVIDHSLELLTVSPVIPVVVIDDVESAVPLARALVDGGIRIIGSPCGPLRGCPRSGVSRRPFPRSGWGRER